MCFKCHLTNNNKLQNINEMQYKRIKKNSIDKNYTAPPTFLIFHFSKINSTFFN